MTTIQKVEAYWSNRPCNLRHSPSPVGSRQYFDEVEFRKYFVEPHIPEFAEFPRWFGKKVLEVGCGMGTDTINFARYGADVTAVDLSYKSLELAQHRARVYKLAPSIFFNQANAEELSKTVPVQPYDLIYSFGMIHHTPHPEKVIKEIKKYCDKNTTVKIMVYYRYSWKVLWMLLSYGYSKNFIAKYSEAEMGCPVTHACSKREARKLLKGFRITEMKVEHIFPYEIPAYRNYEYRRNWYFNWIPKKMFRWLERHFGWQLLITCHLE